jgi:hypothetical protein
MKFRSSHIFIIVAVLVIFFVFRNTSGYMTGFPVQTNISDSTFDNLFQSDKLGYQLKCTPGSPCDVTTGKGCGYYTKDLTPGGYCDDQIAVNTAANYKLKDEPMYSIPLGN